MIYLATLGFALLLTLALTPPARALGRLWGLVDAPGGRRKHQGVIPRTGGLALFGGFFVTVLLITVLPAVLPPPWADWFPVRNDPNVIAAYLGVEDADEAVAVIEGNA